jgi:pimeloyl-ACP methyl ester carboxylesterase
VSLQCTYYPGGFVADPASDKVKAIPKKEVVPVILLHGWEGQRREFDFTAGFLQSRGHAVIAVDLRGHGGSLSRLSYNREVRLDLDRMRRSELNSMIWDVDAAKRFLFQKNNEGELNIDLLCVVGAEMGAIVATNWASLDWDWPQLPAGRQGRDVKALVLLSPLQSYKGITLNRALGHPALQRVLSTMIVVGSEDEEGVRDARAIYNRLERFRRPTSDAGETPAYVDLFFVQPKTSLRGTKLLRARGLTVNEDIARFIGLRLVANKERFPWRERRRLTEN